jgi:hypothetical protein
MTITLTGNSNSIKKEALKEDNTGIKRPTTLPEKNNKKINHTSKPSSVLFYKK